MKAQIRSISILIAALGGEGGGVLADWLIDAANQLDFPVQSTSVPGVAQRTGATTYYVEIFPVPRSQLAGATPVLSLTPTPGDVDLVAASELVEAGRALQAGFVTRDRTLLVSSTHREYAVSEKAAMADGRYDSTRVAEAASVKARRAILFDMLVLAQRHGTVVNTVMFGAMAGAGALPFPRENCEEAIRRSGKAVNASLRGFAAGFEWGAGRPQPSEPRQAAPDTGILQSLRLCALPESVREIATAGVEQTIDYQDQRYACLYLNRVERILAAEAIGLPADFTVTREAARYLALWMSYEDVIRVADLKTRRDRLERVRREVGAGSDEPLRVTEYMKPGLDEVCSVLPTSLARWLRRKLAHRADRLHIGMHVRTDTIVGFAMLCALRSLRPFRRRMSRYASEQQAIERWLEVIEAALGRSPTLAKELALCGNLVKGYGETSERGHRNLADILADVQARMQLSGGANGTGGWLGLAERVEASRVAALADPESRQLAGVLGIAQREPKPQPIRIFRRRPQDDVALKNLRKS
jgi:indolepyruvate ferredoxin oxidoreductase, beta subunit